MASSTAPHQHPEAAENVSPRDRDSLQPRARATRMAILTAAATHFARDGYHATSLDRVLADSGGTKGALYFHFASKQALARAVVAEMVQGWWDLREQVEERGLDPLSALIALVDEVVARLIESPIARGGTRLIAERPLAAPEANRHFGMGEQDALALLTKATEAGLLRESVDPGVVARQVVALLAGHRQICDALDDREGLWQRVDEAWTLLLPAVASDAWLAEWRASDWSMRPRPRAGYPDPATD
jgi:AcrR family transcriptional regulator